MTRSARGMRARNRFRCRPLALTSRLRSPLFSTALAALTLIASVTLSSTAQAAEPAAKATASSAKVPAPSGQAVYEHWCAPCHAPGPGHPGTQSLQLKYGGKTPAVLLERTDLSPQAVAVFVRQGVLMMAPFRKTEVSDAELAALSEYVARNFRSK